MNTRPLQRACNNLLLNADAFNLSYISLHQFHPNWDVNTDLRLSIFQKCVGLIGAAFLTAQHLDQLDEGTVAFPSSLTGRVRPSEIKTLNIRYEQFIKFGCFHSIFSVTEAAIRTITENIYPALYKRYTNFGPLYAALLATNRLDLSQWISFLDLLRYTCNSIHTNGVFSPSGKTPHALNIDWRGHTYSFMAQQPIDFVSWDFISRMFNDLNEFLSILMRHSTVAAVLCISDPIRPITSVAHPNP